MEEASAPSVFTAAALIDHLFNLSKVLQGAQSDDIIHFNTQEVRITTSEFLQTPLASSLFVSKLDGSWRISTSLENLKLSPLSTLVIIKGKGPVLQGKPLEAQLQAVNLPHIGSSFDTLRSLISIGVGTFFTEITSDNKTEMVITTKKKINELALSLQHLNQMIHVPDLSLTLHPVIKDAVAKGGNLGNYTELITENTLTDSTFLNSVQAIVNDWVKSIQGVTKVDREVSDGSALDEANFWVSMDSSLADISSQLESDGVLLTLEVLKYAKRYHATVSFFSDIGIKDAMTLSADYNKLMKDIPLPELIAAESFGKIQEAIVLIFNHMKKLRATSYPIRRALPFAEAISSDLEKKLRPMMLDLMSLEYSEFVNQVNDLEAIFETWDRQLREFTNLARELLRKREEKFIFVKINSRTNLLKDRLDEAVAFRKAHIEFVETLNSDIYQKDLDYAYSVVKDVDIVNSEKNWTSARRAYDRRVEQIESTVVEELRHKLDSQRNSNEMFQVFQSFKALLDRPRIRGAIQEYQSQLLAVVKEEISHLQSNFSQKDNLECVAFSKDYPNCAFVLLWARQIDQKLSFLLAKIELVLGKDWSSYAEGQKIYSETMVFKKKLNLDPLYEEWLSSAEGKLVSGTVIISTRDKVSDIKVNFDDSLLSFYKEVRALCYQEFAVPHSLLLNARHVRKLYPHAVELKESLELIPSVLKNIESLDDLGILVQDETALLFELIEACLQIEWEALSRAQDLHTIDVVSSDNNALSKVLELEDLISDLFNKSEMLLNFHEEMAAIFQSLQQCEFCEADLLSHVRSLQSVLDRISKEAFSNVELIVTPLNKRLAEQLVQRYATTKLTFADYSHTLRISNSVEVQPSLEDSKAKLYYSTQSSVKTLLSLQPLSLSSLGLSLMEEGLDFSDHLSTITKHLDSLLLEIEDDMELADKLVTSWYQFQTLWDVNTETVLSSLSLVQWLELLDDIKQSREFFDSADTQKSFGVVTVDYGQAQSQTISRFNLWNKEVLDSFADFVCGLAHDTHDELLRARKVLESSELDLSSVQGTVNTITAVQKQKSFCTSMSERLEKLIVSERMIAKNRITFSDDYIFVDQLQNDLSVVDSLTAKLSSAIGDNFDIIKRTVEAECVRVQNLIAEAKTSWSSSKPFDDSSSPREAVLELSAIEASMTSLESKKSMLLEATSLLGLPITISGDLSGLIDELKDSRSVWVSLESLWSSLDDLKQLSWNSLKPRALRKRLDDLLAYTRSMPLRVRQHRPFQKFLSTITDLTNSQKVLVSLREDFVKERHIKALFKAVGATYSPELSVGDVWSLNLSFNINVVNSILEQANSERAIEEEVQKIKDAWEEQALEFFDMKGHSLVKNFPHLLQLSSNHISTLSSIKNSPVFRTFEKDVSNLEASLNDIFQILNVWVVVQRQWIDLEGVFDSESGIRKLLPAEYARFHSVSTEYQSTLKKVYRSQLVIEIHSIQDIFQTMERLSDSLTKVSKALSEFLEKQRELCARLYFVGNDDLIDMIANKANVGRHLKKMFSGVSSVVYNEDGTLITSVCSAGAETLILSDPVSLLQYPRLDEWMNQLEYEIKITLSKMVEGSLDQFERLPFLSWYGKFPLQIMLLTLQISWTASVERALDSNSLETLMDSTSRILDDLTTTVVHGQAREALVVEVVHHKNVIQELIGSCCKSPLEFGWLKQQRFYLQRGADPLSRVKVNQSSKSFSYGFEYLGDMERLVYTPLLNDCFVSMVGALEQGLGGSPFGPAGTGKTETVKALGQNLGKMVLVFNCDESFDFQAITRLLLGICQIGGWGCFDEFNRLDKNILSAVSSQLELIELALKSNSEYVKLLDKATPLASGTGLFVTMNPEYAGRSSLPENLKKLFRSFSMQKPDSQIITEVLLRASGFSEAPHLSTKLVQLFQGLREESSNQKHYDFGLRALKSSLEHATRVKNSYTGVSETSVIAKALDEMVMPRLVACDLDLYLITRDRIFGDYEVLETQSSLMDSLRAIAQSKGLSASELWLEKVAQLHQIQQTQQGIMLVGSSGCGKSALWTSLLEVYSQDGDVVQHVIDPKVITKLELFGFLDPITREWVDGLLTSIIRRLNYDLRGESIKPTWIIFDGDVDPIWVESLNSVLDDNKILTLPNGERLKIPASVRFLFEVSNLDHATPATVSRCGMIWMGDNIVQADHVFKHEAFNFRNSPIESLILTEQNMLSIQSSYAEAVSKAIQANTLRDLLTFCNAEIKYVMASHGTAIIRNLFLFARSLLSRAVTEEGESFLLSTEFVHRSLLLSLIWAFTGGAPEEDRLKLARKLTSLPQFQSHLAPGGDDNILDYELDPSGSWVSLFSRIKQEPLEAHAIASPNTVIETIDTLRHQNVLYSILQQKRSLILCGPPGSGKTMTLYASLQQSPEIELSNMNFSKETEPESVLKALEQVCEYKRTPDGYTLRPKTTGKRVVLFADEINLPRSDEYDTQRVINFLRQLIEQGGFWRPIDLQWVRLVDVQFVGACNPPTDVGRVALSPRFLSHLPVIMVGYPGPTSLVQIYSAFNASVLKIVPQLAGYSGELTSAMLEVYFKTIEHFGASERPHYIYSPRELTRWVRGIYAAIRPVDSLDLSGLVRLWAHEALRLFSDRLVELEEKTWCWNLIKTVGSNQFPLRDIHGTLELPILYSDWLSLNYEPVGQTEITKFIKERLNVFSDEILDIDLTLYPDSVDHILRIDRVLKQSQGHLILVGPSSSGKTTLTRFVAWVNGLNVCQLSVRRRYALSEFDNTLKNLLKRTGVEGEKICFIVDESTILDASFLERMNSLLANSQIQEIFDVDEYTMILSACKDQVNARGLLLDTPEELYNWFTEQVAANLHVVFTISAPESSNASPIIASPALFNRCVLNWMGYWSDETLIIVTRELLRTVPIDNSSYQRPESYAGQILSIESYRDAIVDSFIYVHNSLPRRVSPGKLVEMVNNFTRVYDAKSQELSAHQTHINSGLIKLKETMIKVKTLKEELSSKEESLKVKEIEARQTLNKILTEQNEAERKQEASIEIQAALERQDVYLGERRGIVMKDLALAEPAVLEARKGVQNIKKQHLTELRSMSTPPATVQLVLESVCVLLGYNVQSWRDVQSVIRKDDFIASIVMFDCESQVTAEVREYMTETYLSRPGYNFAAADRASKACGPLLQWVEAQIKYAVVLDKIGPLREEVENLEEESARTQARLMAADDMIKELEESIEHYKDGYSELIREIENIKSEMATVEEKVVRSVELVESLSSERTRWAGSIRKFDIEYQNLCGTALIAAAVLTHSGTMDQKNRSIFIGRCLHQLKLAGVTFDTGFKLTTFLNTPSNLLQWEEKGLPNDELFFGNVTIIEKTQKVPLIVDPQGTILETVCAKAAPKKITLTSFLDDGFVRILENSLRFGGCLLIQDAEYFDPIVSPLLNGDVQKVGGRELVKIAGKDIDCSKAFELILYTRDSSFVPSPFVETRTSIVDFTITDSSLETQALNMTLAVEAPEVEKQRVEMIMLDGEYKVKLRDLEESLLTALSESKQDLLSNTSLLETLEKLKTESVEVQKKMRDTSQVMEMVETVAAQYEPFVRSVALTYGIVRALSILSDFYQYSLMSYTTCVEKVLHAALKTSGTGRVYELTDELYKEVYAQVCIGLRNKDKVVLALSLSLMYLSEKDGSRFSKFALTLLMSANKLYPGAVSDAFKVLSIEIDEATASTLIETGDVSDLDESIKTLSPFLSELFGVDGFNGAIAVLSDFLRTGSVPFASKYSLEDVISINKGCPIILGSAAGFDASSRVRSLSDLRKAPLTVVAMGSKESVALATREMMACCRSGSWLLIQNVQIAQLWLEYLEKKLQNIALHPNFRLFLTCDAQSHIPATLLRYSDLLMFENPPGVKTLMNDYIKLVEAKDDHTVEKTYIYFLTTWYHAIVQESSRFAPLSLSKKYEFNDSDFEGALFLIDKWFDTVHNGRTNVPPEHIDWQAIQYLVSVIIYGGKTTCATDCQLLKDLASKLFCIEAFDNGFTLIQNAITARDGLFLSPPEEKNIASYKIWISNLPDLQPLAWLGLESNVEKEMTARENEEIANEAGQIFESVVGSAM